MAMRAWKAGGIAASLAFGGLVTAAAKSPTRAGDPPVTYLKQNWSADERNQFYLTSQGSELVPYDWFLILEQTGAETLFRENLARYGFLPGPVGAGNPDNLPLGFVSDRESRAFNGFVMNRWVGLTCAACHTGAIRYTKPGDANPTLLILDGAPSQGDFGRFMTELAATIAETTSDEAKFDRFAHRLLKARYDDSSKTALHAQFAQFAFGFARLAACSKMPTDTNTGNTIEWGPGRVDAFGVIFNSVCNLGLNMPQNNFSPNAPVNYPFLWNISRQDHIQWHGEVPNAKFVDRVARNAGEVLGVFAKLHIDPDNWYYDSTIRRLNLISLESRLEKLTPPPWPTAILGNIDRNAALRGKDLYRQNCTQEGCHALLTPGSNQIVSIKPYPLDELQTDPTTTVNIHTRMVQTGPLVGRHITFPTSPKLGATAPAGDVVQSAVFKSLIDPNGLSIAVAVVNNPFVAAALRLIAATAPQPQPLPLTRTDLGNIGYEARPLHGIWATAPYLHNGSVPNLAQLLTPPAQRVKTFRVGNYEYDPVNVGYRSEVSDGGMVYDTELPGNHNTGHFFGTQLSDTQKHDLIEYLKTL